MRAFRLLPPHKAFEVHSLEIIRRLAETRQDIDEDLYRRARALVLRKLERPRP